VFSKLTLANLSLREVLQEAEQPINFSYFSNTAMASVLSLMTDGKSVEVGLVGTTELSASRPKTGMPCAGAICSARSSLVRMGFPTG
jgi:hypothetical protein